MTPVGKGLLGSTQHLATAVLSVAIVHEVKCHALNMFYRSHSIAEKCCCCLLTQAWRLFETRDLLTKHLYPYHA